jgi:predicted Zn-dependent protease
MRRVVAFFLAATLGAQTGDPILTILKQEMERSRGLRIAGGRDVPYYFEYSIDDVQSYVVNTTLGGLIDEVRNRARVPQVRVRVGDYAFDNSNYVLSDGNFAARYDSGLLPQDDNPLALRQQLWLMTDRTFKSALESIGRKRSAMESVNVAADRLPDFWKAEPVKLINEAKAPVLDQALWKKRVLAASARFGAFPAVLSSSVDIESIINTSYFVNSEGTEAKYPDNIHYIRVRASGLAEDGSTVRDHVVFHAIDPARLPSEGELNQAVDAVGRNVTALATAPVGDLYAGPILFEGEAGAQLMAEVLATQLYLPRRPVANAGQSSRFTPSELEGRLGSRILPSTFTVVDDPTQSEFRGRSLFGSYPIDGEGVVPKPVTVIEGGVFKTPLLSRQPIAGFTASNGRGRLPGSYGHRMATLSNLFVKSSETVSSAELKKKMMDLVKQRSKPFGIIVRRMDYPSSAGGDELRRLAVSLGNSAGGNVLSSPLLVYRVYPDGKEELIRGVRFRGLNLRTLKDITAASTELHQFDFIGNRGPFALMGLGGYVYPATVVAPALLFEDLELEHPQIEVPRLPTVPPPTLSTTAAN